MTCKVVLNVESGALPQRGYVFEGPAECVIGRGDDCPLQVPAMRPSTSATNRVRSRRACRQRCSGASTSRR